MMRSIEQYFIAAATHGVTYWRHNICAVFNAILTISAFSFLFTASASLYDDERYSPFLFIYAGTVTPSWFNVTYAWPQKQKLQWIFNYNSPRQQIKASAPSFIPRLCQHFPISRRRWFSLVILLLIILLSSFTQVEHRLCINHYFQTSSSPSSSRHSHLFK